MSSDARAETGAIVGLRGLRRALLRASVLFGSLAVAVVMLFGQGSERPMRYADGNEGIDEILTGTVASPSRYVIGRSVLQPAGSGPCLYFPDGTRRGTC